MSKKAKTKAPTFTSTKKKRMVKIISLIIMVLFTGTLAAQVYTDYIGAGHTNGISITSSTNANTTDSVATANGSGLGIDQYAASRFLSFCSMGADYETITAVANQGYSDWLDGQFAISLQSDFTAKTWSIWNHFKPQFVSMWGQTAIENAGDAVIPYWFYFKMAWWDEILKKDDHVRQRTTQALSQIFVISEKSNLQLSGPGMANFYDVLYTNAFGNFRDLLFDVTMHPMMGFYLSHINNPKSDPVNNIHPDENYAREIMQLFSIGLFELNIDGSRQQDANGNDIPTYNNNDIKEFAKIFTGLAPAGYWWPWDDYSYISTIWGDQYNESPATTINWQPMITFDNWHEPGQKFLLNGQVVPAGQSALQDINDAVDNLFNHPNVGPFIGRLLIQRMVKSNPTPAYITRVAQKFNDNGNGVRGDMQAVIKTILTDAEAVDCEWQTKVESGKLREPLLMYTQALRAFNVYNQSNKLWNWGYQFDEAVSQGVLASPSVFNYYLPDYQPNGAIASANLVAPEYQIHTSATCINYINLVYEWFIDGYYGEIATQASGTVMNTPGYDLNELLPIDYLDLDLSDELAIAGNATNLVERINLIVAGGLLSNTSKSNIVNAITPLNNTDRVKAALYLVFIAPEYCVQK